MVYLNKSRFSGVSRQIGPGEYVAILERATSESVVQSENLIEKLMLIQTVLR
jgi:hypothetical protein